MFDVAVMADLGGLLKGLSFKTAYSVDYTSYYSEAYAEKYDLTKGQVLKKGLELLYRQDKHS